MGLKGKIMKKEVKIKKQIKNGINGLKNIQYQIQKTHDQLETISLCLYNFLNDLSDVIDYIEKDYYTNND